MAGNVYLGRVQNVLPSMEAAFIDVGKGRNAVLYAGEVNWDAAGMEGQPRRIEQAGDRNVDVCYRPIRDFDDRLVSILVILTGRATKIKFDTRHSAATAERPPGSPPA